MKNIFISFHHKLNKNHSKKIQEIDSKRSYMYNDITINNGSKIKNEDNLTDDEIRQEIRDKYLKDIDIIIVIVGSDSINRKHIDWEIYGSCYDYKNDKPPAAVVVIHCLSEIGHSWILDKELMNIYDSKFNNPPRHWPKDKSKEDLEWLPNRLKDSLLNNYNYDDIIKQEYSKCMNLKHAVFPIVEYKRIIEDNNILYLAIRQAITYQKSNEGKWDLSPLKRQNNKSDTRKIFNQVEA